MKTLCIAEKPSVGMAIKNALGVRGKNANGFIEGEDKIITWCVGHLVRMSYPEKYGKEYEQWALETLPFIPAKDAYKYEPNEATKKQLEVVRNLYNRTDIDKLYIFPDPAQEGYYLQQLVLNFAGINPSIQIYCAVCDSQTEEEIIRAYNEAIPWSDPKFTNMVKAGYMRAKEDYLVGINYSRVLTMKYQKYLTDCIGDARKVVAVGRVMSCVLGMVVRREREIAEFIPENYYRIEAVINNLSAVWKVTEDSSLYGTPYLYQDKGIKEREKKDWFINQLPENIKVLQIETKSEKRSPPLLFSLTELQAECSKRFKMNPQKVLSIAQELYEKRLTTYPRTDSRYLTTSVAREIEGNIKGLAKIKEYQKFSEDIINNRMHSSLIKSKYVNDEKVEDHYAIIPTGRGYGEIEDLSADTRAVYDVIVRRFLSIFYPPAQYQKAEVEFIAGREHFYLSKKVLEKEGYLSISGFKEDNPQTVKGLESIKKMKKGDVFSAKYLASDVETSPPKRYTSESLILAMDNAGQFVEDEQLREVLKETKGIGTTATRAAILDKLVNTNHYLKLNEKTQVYAPEFKGEIIYDILNETIPTILNPAFSASWTSGLKKIEKGEISDNVYYQKLSMDVEKNVENIKTEDKTENLISDFRKLSERYKKEVKEASVTYDCPVCGKPLKRTKKGFCCSNYGKEEEKCNFFLSYAINGKTLSSSQTGKLLKERKLDVISGFKKKDGTLFSAPLYILPDGKISFSPPDDYKTDAKCPKCNRIFEEDAYKWECPGCHLRIQRIVAGKKISYENFKKLTKGEETPFINGFKKKDSTETFTAKLVLKNGEMSFIFRSGPVRDTYCPLCRKEVVYASFGMKCTDYKNGCTFAVGSTICGKSLSDEQLIKLIREKQLPEIKGFKKQNGEEFSAPLHISEDGQIKFGFIPKMLNIKCPLCKQDRLCDTGKTIECGKCHSRVPSVYCGKRLTQEDIINLMIHGRTGKISGFLKKDGGKFSAVLIRDVNNKFRFDF